MPGVQGLAGFLLRLMGRPVKSYDSGKDADNIPVAYILRKRDIHLQRTSASSAVFASVSTHRGTFHWSYARGFLPQGPAPELGGSIFLKHPHLVSGARGKEGNRSRYYNARTKQFLCLAKNVRLIPAIDDKTTISCSATRTAVIVVFHDGLYSLLQECLYLDVGRHGF